MPYRSMAEGYRGIARRRGRIQTGTVTGGELVAMLQGGPPVRDGAHRVDDMARRQVVGVGDHGMAGRLRSSGLLHVIRACQSQLDAGEGVDGVAGRLTDSPCCNYFDYNNEYAPSLL